MNKKQFIQQVMIRSLPAVDKLPDALDYAEQLWQALTAKGYGDSTPSLRVGQDYYQALNPQQQKYFDRFWRAFGFKKGRNGAAQRWQQLGVLKDEQYQLIIQAAKKEADRLLPPGQARKMAQGWLTEQRWQDEQPIKVDQQQQKNHVLVHLKNELTHLKKLYQSSGHPALEKQIKQLEKRWADVR